MIQLVRGGNYNDTTNAGVFNFNRTTTQAAGNINNSFRLVMRDYDIRII